MTYRKSCTKSKTGLSFDEASNRPLDKLRTGGLLINKRIRGPRPFTPRSRHVYGLLIMRIRVDEQGKVVSAKTICGDEFVAEVSEEAILKTTYEPTIIAGKPVPVIAFAVYQFVAR